MRSSCLLPPQPFPVPALQIAPVLRYNEILEIEKAAQHVVRNTTLYSKAVWLSLTPDERAILLDGYTIGVPTVPLADLYDGCEAALRKRGGEVRLRTGVKAMEPQMHTHAHRWS